MSAARRRGCLNGMDAQLVGDPFQQFDVRFNHKLLVGRLTDRLRKPRMKKN
jgi:hypothetical protein